MEAGRGTNRTALAAAIIGGLALLFVVALVFDLGPFAEDELSAPEFLAQGDDICAQAHDEFLSLQASTPRTAEDAADLTQTLLDIAEEERSALEELEGPATLDAPLASYLQERERGIELLRDGLDAAKDDNANGYEAAQAKLAANQLDRQDAARRVGFNQCSKPLVEQAELERQAQPPG